MEDTWPLPPALVREQSRWVPVRWADLPGMDRDAVNEAWPAWLQSCQRPAPDWRALCPEIAQLANASAEVQRRWMREKLQPYRVETLDQRSEGLLTGYYEPALTGSRRAQGAFQVPLYAPPAQLAQRKPWFSRQEIETLPAARAWLMRLEDLTRPG
jgi:membrane-bound lytic murein transglycosylase A